ncbi:MAG TPA: S-methyl-5-thioribose-1-phosphate isomerase [Thermoanaerobaculia bacterium]|nr:S-methyl-5-thioribose-1-phosphate isomerase [Thermoanaerobaculia bacterium]
MTPNSAVEPIRWRGDAVELLDQRKLPAAVEYVVCRDAQSVAEAIRSMIVRGAPAIGVAAAFGLALAARGNEDFDAAAAQMRAARPTAVNLGWAVERMQEARAAGRDLALEAEAIYREDIEANRRIGRDGSRLLADGATVLTHCNAGALATAGYGTALGVIRAAVEEGKRVAVFADETRPYLQGARLTAWELQQDGIDVTLITDSMAGHFFQKDQFDAVIVGADRIAANGDTANKIGTYPVAVLASAHGVPFYVAAPISTIDVQCPDGRSIPIEERSAAEVVDIGGIRVAPEGIAVRHPAFDVTPARLITAIITDRGVLRPPYDESIRAAMNDDVKPNQS